MGPNVKVMPITRRGEEHNYSRSMRTIGSGSRLAEFAPVLLFQLYLVFLRGGFDAFPGGVALGIGHSLHLLETGDCIAYVSSVMDRFLTLLREGEVFIGDVIAAGIGDLGHASQSSNPTTV